ncbi:hypothetical protein LCGC14_0396610 [marine sediment metagenome]|uniref:Uncharacterized protein n=1 Tax=marine sediment metagenome TaxID=412755 RepID=A0A0F9T3X4_9ZZZZ
MWATCFRCDSQFLYEGSTDTASYRLHRGNYPIASRIGGKMDKQIKTVKTEKKNPPSIMDGYECLVKRKGVRSLQA